jgi:hypothetical protein
MMPATARLYPQRDESRGQRQTDSCVRGGTNAAPEVAPVLRPASPFQAQAEISVTHLP